MISSRTVRLAVDKETARKHIVERIDTIRTTSEDSRITIKSSSGLVLAHLRDHELPDGELGTTLEYRTGASLFLSHAGATARRIRAAVSKYEV